MVNQLLCRSATPSHYFLNLSCTHYFSIFVSMDFFFLSLSLAKIGKPNVAIASFNIRRQNLWNISSWSSPLLRISLWQYYLYCIVHPSPLNHFRVFSSWSIEERELLSADSRLWSVGASVALSSDHRRHPSVTGSFPVDVQTWSWFTGTLVYLL